MGKLNYIIILSLTMFFLISCQQTVTCNKPYILVGTGCCLDSDGNSICDQDEKVPDQGARLEDTKKEQPVCNPPYMMKGIVELSGRSIEDEVRLAFESWRGEPYDAMYTRRDLQVRYNKMHGITPKAIVKPIKEKIIDIKDTKHIPKADIPNMIISLDAQMKEAADKLNFEEAIAIRDRIKELEKRING